MTKSCPGFVPWFVGEARARDRRVGVPSSSFDAVVEEDDFAESRVATPDRV